MSTPHDKCIYIHMLIVFIHMHTTYMETVQRALLTTDI